LLIAEQSYDRRADEISRDEKQSWLGVAEMLSGKSGARC
jgi:hypothetical protein